VADELRPPGDRPEQAEPGRRRIGRARVGRAVGKARMPERAVTDVIRPETAAAAPVFVDPSGGRRRRVRRTAYAIGVLLLLILAAIWLSQLSGSTRAPEPRPCASGSAAGCRR